MPYKVIVSEIAKQNIEESIGYYIEMVNKKVATRFLRDFRKVYKALQINPFYQYHDNNYRFLPFSKFPYIAFFIVDEKDKTVLINAIFHTSLNPAKYPPL
jgi:plasmid stabilization system protein ParE